MSSLKTFIGSLSEGAATILEDTITEKSDRSGTIDTGSYMLNAMASASLHGGVQDNKITIFAGEQGTGKSFLALSMCATFLQRHPDGIVYYHDTEHAMEPLTFKRFGIDPKQVLISRPRFIEEWKARTVEFLQKYASWEERPRMMIVLDSLGALPTKKQFEEGPSDDISADMGRRAAQISNAFMVLNQHLGPTLVPLIVTNHVYANVSGYGPMKKMGGGEKPMYLASTIFFISKKRLGEKGDQEGNIVTIETVKSRYTKVGRKGETVIHFNKGLDRYWGLIDIATKHGIFSQTVNRLTLPGGKKVFRSAIEKEPHEYFTPDVMDALEKAVFQEFHLGGDECPPNSNT